MRTIIKNVNIVTKDKIIYNGVCGYTEGIIDYVGTENQQGDREIDGKNNYLIPGFVEIHCHGGNGYEFMDASESEIKKIADYHLSHGTTTMLATTLTASYDETLSALDTFKKYKKNHPNSTLKGVHLEGPWLNPSQCGAQDTANMKEPDVKELIRLKKEYPFIERITSAPELKNGMEFGKKGKELNIVMSMGHTDADFKIVEKARENGYTLMTHLYSGMKGMTRKNSYRIAGAVEAGLYFDDLYVEIIADGRHLPTELLKFIYKCKGSDKICLITDAIRASGLKNGEKSVIGSLKNGMAVIVEDEVAKLPDRQSFAGSTATSDRLYRVMGKAIGNDMVALSKMSSYNPAKVMGYDNIGEIATGKSADLIIINDNLEIQKVITEKEN